MASGLGVTRRRVLGMVGRLGLGVGGAAMGGVLQNPHMRTAAATDKAAALDEPAVATERRPYSATSRSALCNRQLFGSSRCRDAVGAGAICPDAAGHQRRRGAGWHFRSQSEAVSWSEATASSAQRVHGRCSTDSARTSASRSGAAASRGVALAGGVSAPSSTRAPLRLISATWLAKSFRTSFAGGLLLRARYLYVHDKPRPLVSAARDVADLTSIASSGCRSSCRSAGFWPMCRWPRARGFGCRAARSRGLGTTGRSGTRG